MKKRAEFEEKYKVDVQTDGQGKSMVVDREKDEVELEEEKKKIERLAKKGIVRKTKPLKPIPVFKQGEGEHKRAFYYRIDKTIQSMKKRAEFEEKYKVDVQTDGQGKSMVVDREKDEVELEEEKKKI